MNTIDWTKATVIVPEQLPKAVFSYLSAPHARP
ncbi:hypothetical protein HNR40_009079 [Nonomuraea endophytica]|uniref:Uncharacterized protein n=1 Tax=Nonomuraea endophytica TaxID=714136 RepID=A0A7W8EL70_9ACTN|nr:hypothetical protein [Nonomuraea endophytica]